jgi:F0F1-type ATP synthase membrane subunit b/b'
LSEDDREKLAGLDDAWNRFRDGMEEANLIIQKSYAQLKTEMDHIIDDFKKNVQDNKKNFQNQAPYSVDKNMDN